MSYAAQAMHSAALPFMFDSAMDVSIAEGLGHGTLTDWWNSFRILQAAEVRLTLLRVPLGVLHRQCSGLVGFLLSCPKATYVRVKWWIPS